MPSPVYVYIYFVFTTKYRKKLLTEDIQQTITWAFKDQAQKLSIEVFAITIKLDHERKDPSRFYDHQLTEPRSYSSQN